MFYQSSNIVILVIPNLLQILQEKMSKRTMMDYNGDQVLMLLPIQNKQTQQNDFNSHVQGWQVMLLQI